MHNIDVKTLKDGDNFKEYVLNIVKDSYLKDGEMPYPIAVLMSKNRQVKIIGVPMEFPSPEMAGPYKSVVAKNLKKVAKEMDAVRYLWIAESWMSVRPIEDPNPELAPSDDPKAITVILVADETEGKCVTDIYMPEFKDVKSIELNLMEEYTHAHKPGDPLGTFQGIVYDPSKDVQSDISPN